MESPLSTLKRVLQNIANNASTAAKQEALSYQGLQFPDNFSNNLELLELTNKLVSDGITEVSPVTILALVTDTESHLLEYDEVVLICYLNNIFN